VLRCWCFQQTAILWGYKKADRRGLPAFDAVMNDNENNLTPGIIFLFWIPLALTWIMMALEGPIVAP